MTHPLQLTAPSRPLGSTGPLRRGLAAAVTAGLLLAGLPAGSAWGIERTPSDSGVSETYEASGQHGKADGVRAGHTHDGDKAEARRSAEDRKLLLASTWEPDPALLAPREQDTEATATLRASLADAVDLLRAAVSAHEKTMRRSQQASERLAQARSDVAAAILATAAARRQAEKDRVALMSLMTETYRNGSVGSLSLVLGGSGGNRDEDRYSGEALFSGLTLLSQMSSSQDDALRAARRSARALAEVQRAEEEARDREEARARDARQAERRSETVRTRVLEEVEEIEDLVRQSMLRDEVKRRQQAARAEREALLAADRGFLEAFVGLTPAASERLMHAAARLAATSRGGVVFPLPADAPWFDNDNWGGDSGLWAAGHTGADFSAPCGTPVLASTRGTVSVHTDQGWSGRWLVVIEGIDGVASTWYAHMRDVAVKDGERVKAGQRLGSVGSEGNSTGCHLHLEVHPLGGSIYEDNVDPVAFLRLTGAYPTVSAVTAPR